MRERGTPFVLFRRTARWTYPWIGKPQVPQQQVSRAPMTIALWVPTGVQLPLVSGPLREPLRFCLLSWFSLWSAAAVALQIECPKRPSENGKSCLSVPNFGSLGR
jgi:hypothetical protein